MELKNKNKNNTPRATFADYEAEWNLGYSLESWS